MKDKERAKILAKSIFEAMRQSKDDKKIIANFLAYLQNHRLINFIPEILKELENLHLKDTDTVAVHIASRDKLDDKAVKHIVKILKDKTKHDILVKASIDESMIGGLMIKYQDKLIDLSIKQQLKLLNKQLIN